MKLFLFLVLFFSTSSFSQLREEFDKRGLLLTSGTTPWSAHINFSTNGSMSVPADSRARFNEIVLGADRDFLKAKTLDDKVDFKVEVLKKNGKIKTLTQQQMIYSRLEKNKYNREVTNTFFESSKIDFDTDGKITNYLLCDIEWENLWGPSADKENYYCIEATPELCSKMEEKGIGELNFSSDRAQQCEDFYKNLAKVSKELNLGVSVTQAARSIVGMEHLNTFSNDEIGRSFHTSFLPVNDSFSNASSAWRSARDISRLLSACRKLLSNNRGDSTPRVNVQVVPESTKR